jgi:hypothetical protein
MYLSHKIENDMEYVNNEFLSPQLYVTRTVIDKYISLKTISYADLAYIACMHYKYDAMGSRNKDLKMMEQNKCSDKMMAKFSEFNIKEFISQCAIFSNKLVHGINVFLSQEKQRILKSVILLNNAFKNVSPVIFGMFKSN